MRQFDMEKKARLEANYKTAKAEEKSEQIAQLLSRQIKLKEMYEDRMNDALDLNQFGKGSAEENNKKKNSR